MSLQDIDIQNKSKIIEAMKNTIRAQSVKIKLYEETLKEISECLDSFYDNESPRKLFPELRHYAGLIQVMDKVSNDALKNN